MPFLASLMRSRSGWPTCVADFERLTCAYFAAERCRSCTWLKVSYQDQVAQKLGHCQNLITSTVWDPPFPSPLAGFRNKAKLVVGGTVANPTLGILRPDGGVDLRDCALYEETIQQALPTLAAFITEAGLPPYDVVTRRGELKYLLVTAGRTRTSDDVLMARFVLRSTEAEARIRKHLGALTAAIPALRIASLNIQPAHKAVIEGEREIVLTTESRLPFHLNDVDLWLRPQSFFQTNTVVAAALYARARELIADIDAHTAWDLFCGVGGFALHLTQQGRIFIGVEISAEAVASAHQSALNNVTGNVTFVVADALAFAQQNTAPDLVVVNPPRRGIGNELARLLEASDTQTVLYSSCNTESLARDLAAMPSFHVERAAVFDMFPHTEHYEVLALLRR